MKIINNIKKNTIILLVLTIIILIVILKDDYKEILQVLTSMNIMYILLAVFFFFFYVFLKAYTMYITIDNKEKISLREAYKHELITQFFNGVTPYSTGGQPMEIYMIREHNISLAQSTNISIQNFIFYQVALVLFGIFAVTYNYIFKLFPETMFLKKLVLLGFIINALVAFGLILVLISKKFTKFVSKVLVKVLAKVRIIKNKEIILEKVNQKLDEFHNCARALKHKKKLIIKAILLNLLSLVCLYVIPLFVVMSLDDFTSLNVLSTLTSSAYVLLIGSFVPVPGASGGIEFGFLTFYGTFLSKKVVSAVLIMWRFITYYLAIIAGALAFSLEKKVK